MTILEYNPEQNEILDYVNDRVRELLASGVEPKYILVGPSAYKRMREAMGDRFKRSAGEFETYNYLPIVVDPARTDTVCILPAPSECAKGAKIYRMED
jgi:hypothetical protein